MLYWLLTLVVTIYNYVLYYLCFWLPLHKDVFIFPNCEHIQIIDGHWSMLCLSTVVLIFYISWSSVSIQCFGVLSQSLGVDAMSDMAAYFSYIYRICSQVSQCPLLSTFFGYEYDMQPCHFIILPPGDRNSLWNVWY